MSRKLDTIIADITDNLEHSEKGIWLSKKNSQVSYPEKGSDLCFDLEDQSFWFEHRNRCILESIKSFPYSGWLLDVGGGNGCVSLAMEKAGLNTILLEPSLSGAINASTRGISNILCSTLQDAGFKPRCLPAVGLFDVLEHIEKDCEFLECVKDFLAHDGKLYITVPAYSFLWSTEDEYAGHYRRYTLGELLKKLNESGYKIDYATYIFSLLPIPIFLTRTIPSWCGLKGGDASRQRKDHHKRASWLGNLLDVAFDREVKLIRARKRSYFGGSCLLVASTMK